MAVSRRNFLWLGFFGSFVSIVFIGPYAVNLVYRSASGLATVNRGPFVCAYCPLESPMPDRITDGFLQGHRPRLEVIPLSYGDTYVVCNQGYCAKYLLTHSNLFLGVETHPILAAGHTESSQDDAIYDPLPE